MLYILLGMLHALHNSTNFAIFFDWLYPEHLKAIQNTLRLYPEEPEIRAALLKFLKELTSNAHKRLRLDALQGFIIFKECCPLLKDLLLVHQSLDDQTAEQTLYPEKSAARYKLLKNTLEIMTNTMTGGYMLFGVLELYNDDCFLSLSRQALQRVVCLNMEELARYKSAERAVYRFLQEFLKGHAELFLGHFDPETHVRLLVTLKAGLVSETPEILTNSAEAIDELILFVVRERVKIKPKPVLQEKIPLFLAASPTVFFQTTETLLKIVCYEEGDWVYALVHPLYSPAFAFAPLPPAACASLVFFVLLAFAM